MDNSPGTSSPITPHLAPGNWPEPINPGKFPNRVRSQSPEGCSIGLLGMPDDTGIGLNHGQMGAKHGPEAFRRALSCYGTSQPVRSWPRVFDAGDIVPGKDIHETHGRVTEAARAIAELGLIPVGIGGGHDLTYAFVRGVMQGVGTRGQTWTGLYLDAHLDVREAVGSGMPFRRLVEDCSVSRLFVQGLDEAANSAEHVAWFKAHGGQIDALKPDSNWPIDLNDDWFVSFDMDVIDASAAPGVSAMNPCGWSTQHAMAWARAAGQCPAVRCFDIMELSPPFDQEDRTARITASLFLRFLMGLGERDAQMGKIQHD